MSSEPPPPPPLPPTLSTSSLSSLAKEVHLFLSQHLTKPDIEIEARLCLLENSNASRRQCDEGVALISGKLPHVVVSVGVSEANFEEMKKTIAQQLPSDVKAVETESEVIQWKQFRLIYTRDEDGTEKCSAADKKKRLTVADIVVPFGQYDIRIAVSKEIPCAHVNLPVNRPPGFTRRKKRWSATVGDFRYDLTSVFSYNSKDPTEPATTTHEVELEYLLKDRSDVVGVSDVEEILRRMVALIPPKSPHT